MVDTVALSDVSDINYSVRSDEMALVYLYLVKTVCCPSIDLIFLFSLFSFAFVMRCLIVGAGAAGIAFFFLSFVLSFFFFLLVCFDFPREP